MQHMGDKLIKLSAKQKLLITMALLITGLIVYSIGTLTNFFGSPALSVFFIVSQEIAYDIAFGALAVAIALTIITLTIVIRGKDVFAKTRESNAIGAIKEPNKTLDTGPSIGKMQKNTTTVESNVANQENQSFKQSLIKPTRLICPACRKEFSLPIFEGDYIVDFGTPKKSNLTKVCPYCQAPISLKRKGNVETDTWNDNV
jgi:hypothetical protein